MLSFEACYHNNKGSMLGMLKVASPYTFGSPSF
jgi:hypothetical protein